MKNKFLSSLRVVFRICVRIYSSFLKNNNVSRFFVFGFVFMNAGNFCFAYLPVPIAFYSLVILLNVFIIAFCLCLIIAALLFHPEHAKKVADFVGNDFISAHFDNL